MSDEPVTVMIVTPTGEVDAAEATMPESGRDFRDAWRVTGTVIEVDMEVARNIVRDRIRMARTPYLLALDVQYMKAAEQQFDTSQIIAHKQWLRDLPADVRIEQAQTDVELSELLDTLMAEMEARDV